MPHVLQALVELDPYLRFMFNTNNIPFMVTINIPPMVRSCYSRAPSLHAIKNAKIGFINEAKI
jgi:hypothetical protein